MTHLLFENGNSELIGKKFPLTNGIRKHLLGIYKNFNGDKTTNGYKRLGFIVNSSDGIDYNEMKRIKNYFDNFLGDRESDEFVLNGGDEMHNWVNNTLNRAEAMIKSWKKAKEDVGFKNAFRKPHEKNRATKKTGKPTVSKVSTKDVNKKMIDNKSIKYESMLRESSEYVYDASEEYSPSYVLNEFMQCGGKGKISWGELINPASYQKALDEFTKTGRLERFPSRMVYKWMGIIIRNTFILNSCTVLAGHSTYYPTDDLEDFLESYYGDRFVGCDSENVTLVSDINDFNARCEKIGIYESTGVHRDGQYDLFMNQDEVDEYDAKKEKIMRNRLNMTEDELQMLEDKIDRYNKAFGVGRYHNDRFRVEDGKLIRVVDIGYLLDEIGLYEWMRMPDGTDAISDFGLAPLFKVIGEYDDGMLPEQVLVIVNRALDVTHMRGDLSCVFIKGGRKALTSISNGGYYNNESKNGKTIVITESQLRKLSGYLWSKILD